MASAKVRQLEDNLAFRYIADSDRPTNVEDLEKVLLRNQERALKESHALHGTIGPDPNYDEEGNIIPQELWSPDLSFSPFISRTALAGAKKLYNTAISLEKKGLLPKKIAEIYGKFIAKDTPSKTIKKAGEYGRKEATKDMASKEAFDRAIHTVYKKGGSELIEQSGMKESLFSVYNNLMKHRIQGADIKKLSLYEMMHKPGRAGVAASRPREGAQTVFLRKFGITPDELQSTAVHEFTHIAQRQPKRPAIELEALADQYGVDRQFTKNIMDRIIDTWEEAYSKKIEPHLRGGKKITTPGIKPKTHQEYLMQPREMSARAAQIRNLENKSTLTSREQNLLDLFKKEELKNVTEAGLRKMVDKLWMAAPVSVGLDEDLFKEVKE